MGLFIDNTNLLDVFEPALVDWRYQKYRAHLYVPESNLSSDRGDVSDEEEEEDHSLPRRIAPRDMKGYRAKFPPGFELGCFVHVFFRPTKALCDLLQPWRQRLSGHVTSGVYVRMRDALQGLGRTKAG